MSENGKILLDTHRTHTLVLSTVLFPLLLLRSITCSKGNHRLRSLLLTLLLLTSQYSCSLPQKTWAAGSTHRSYKDIFIIAPLHPTCAPPSTNSNRECSFFNAISKVVGQERGRLLHRNSNFKKQLVSFSTTRSLVGPHPVPVNHTNPATRLSLLPSDKLLSPPLRNSRTHFHCCCISTDGNSARPRAGTSLKPSLVSQRLCNRNGNTKRVQPGQCAPHFPLKRNPTHISCPNTTRLRKNGAKRLYTQRASRMWRNTIRSNWIGEVYPARSCPVYSLSSSKPGYPATFSHLGASCVAATVSASPMGTGFLDCVTKTNLLRLPQCQSEGTTKRSVPQKAGRKPNRSSALQCCGLRSPRRGWLKCRSLVKLLDASSSRETLRSCLLNEAEKHTYSYQGPHTDGSCWCWISAIASACSRRLARTSAILSAASNSRRLERLIGEGWTHDVVPLTKIKIGRTVPDAPGIRTRGGCNGGEEGRQYMKETFLTLGQLEKELQRRHRAVGLAIKSGHAAVAFAELDKHLRCAVATVRQWVRHHERSSSTQFQEPLCRWKPGSGDYTSLPQSGALQQERRENQEHTQQGKRDEGKKHEKFDVHRQQHSQTWQQQNELVNQRTCQHGHADLPKPGDEERAPLQGKACLSRSFQPQGDRGGRFSHSFVFSLMEPFIKSASGVLNLCCKDESGEAPRSMHNLYIIARQVLRRLQEYQLLHPFSVDVGNAFLSVAAAAGDSEAVAATLLYMRQQGVKPQRKGYDALLNTLLREGEGYCRLRGSDLLRDMLDQRLPPAPEQLFALVLRDAARVRVQLDKEQQAVIKFQLCLHQGISQREMPSRYESLRREHGCAQAAVTPSGHTGHASELEKDKVKRIDSKEYTGLENSWSRGDGKAANSSSIDAKWPDPRTTKKSDAESHTTAVAAARAALIEEVRRSLHVLREFVAGTQDALLLLQEVVSEQLPLLSERAASRFVAALHTLQFPAIAHISRVLVKHSADIYATGVSVDEQEALPKLAEDEDTSYRTNFAPPGVAGGPNQIGKGIAGPGDTLASGEPLNFRRDETCGTRRLLRDPTIIAPRASEKVCDDKALIAQEQKVSSITPSELEAGGEYTQPHSTDVSQQNGLQGQQQYHVKQSAESSDEPFPLQRAAVCIDCGARLRRVCLTNNERRLLRLGVLKLSAMLHPRQLRALLAFEAALSYKQLRPDVISKMTRRQVSAGSVARSHVGSREGSLQASSAHQEQEPEGKQRCPSTCSVIRKSDQSPKVGGGQTTAISRYCLQVPGISAAPSSTATEGSGGQGNGRGKTSIFSASDIKHEDTSGSCKDTAGKWKTGNAVGSPQWRKLKEDCVPAQQNTRTYQAVRSVVPRYTVVLDAANIAYNSQNRQEGVFSYLQIERVRQELLGRNERPLIILPSAYYWGFSKQRSRQADRKGRRATQTVDGDALIEETVGPEGTRSNRNIPMYQFMHNRPGEKSKRAITEVNLPPEANRLWLCRMGLCPLCTGEIQVPNRCKRSNRSSLSSSTSLKLPVERSPRWQCGSAGDGHNGSEKASFENQSVGSARCGTAALTEGGQRLSCLDRALLQLWEQEECLFVCRSGAHDDHYHLLASLSACSSGSPAASSTLLRPPDGDASDGIKRLENPVLARREPARLQPTVYAQQEYPIIPDHLQGSTSQQQQSDAIRGLQDGVSNVAASCTGSQEGDRLSAEYLLNIILGTQAEKHSFCVDHWNTKEEQGKLCRRTSFSHDDVPSGTCNGLWHRLWRRGDRSRAGVAAAASVDLGRAAGKPVSLAVKNVGDDRRERPSDDPSTTSFLGYSWNDFTARREAFRKDDVPQLADSATSATVSTEAANYPVALLTNDRFRDHRLSTQQRLAFRHWRQLALLPYVFQRKMTLGKSGFAVKRISPGESTRHHLGSFPAIGRDRRLYGGTGHPHQHYRTDRQQSRSTVVRRGHKHVAGGGSSEGEVLGNVDGEANYGCLADDVEAVKPKTKTNGGETAHQKLFRDYVLDEDEEGEDHDNKMLNWAFPLRQRTEPDFLKPGADAWDDRDGLNYMERRIDEWCLDDLDIAASPIASRAESDTQWMSGKSTTPCGSPERCRRAKRERNISRREAWRGVHLEEETEPLLFIGMLQPVTRRVQVSLRKDITGTSSTEMPTDHPKGVVAAATKLPACADTQGDLGVLSQAPEHVLAAVCSHGQPSLSLLDVSHLSAPHGNDALVWHIPLRRTEEKTFQELDGLFGTPPASVTADHPESHNLKGISEHMLKQQVCSHGLPPASDRDNVSGSTRGNTPIDEGGRSLPLVKADTQMDRSLGRKNASRNVFADFDTLSQSSGKDTQSEEASDESDVWLGIDLTPVHQRLRAREHFLRSVEQQVF